MVRRGRQQSATMGASLDAQAQSDRAHSVMRRQVVVIEVEYDGTIDEEPSTWDWHTLADLNPYEHISVLAGGPVIEVPS